MPRSRLALVLLPCFALAILQAACSPRDEDTAEYKAACEGPPLRTTERRNQAQEDGLEINRRHDCIDKASYLAAQAQRARDAAAGTPEAMAAREAERLKRLNEERAAAAAAAPSPGASPAAPATPATISLLDANVASEAELAAVPGIVPDAARQIVDQRSRRAFTG